MIDAGSWTMNPPGLLAQNDGRCGYFYWGQSQGSQKYTFQISTSATMASPVSVTVNSSEVSVVHFYSKLKVNTTYYYRVQPVGVSFPDWSTIKSFKSAPSDATDLVCANANA